MASTRNATRKITVLMVFAFAGLAYASGSHSDGHDHGTDETAIGKPGAVGKVNRTITVEMSDDMRYTPSAIEVKKDETVRFIVQNKGRVQHELSLGTEKDLLEHLEAMKKYPDMEHDEPGKVTPAPGKQGEMVWQFTKPGVVNFACLVPGHYEAGMQGSIKVLQK
jgi:uncharacterized cupredoxin-like copper-binding protein